MSAALDIPLPAAVVPDPKPEIFDAVAVEERDPRQPWSWLIKFWYGICFVAEWLFGLVSLLACLAVLAAIPILNLVSLGYLLEASGRVARSGRLRDGFIDIGKFARIGSMVIGTWLCLLVPRLVSSLASDAWLIDPDGASAQVWRVVQIAITVLVVTHIMLAWYSGGRLRHFFWPLLAPFQLASRVVLGRMVEPVTRPLIALAWPALAEDLFRRQALSSWFPPAIFLAGYRRGRMYAEARDAVWEFTTSLRLLQYFWLGLRGMVGALIWLLLPSLMLMAGTSGRGPATIVVGYVGAIAMAVVASYLPFLLTQFACQSRFSALFDVKQVRSNFRRAPVAFWVALVVTLLFALPLYLLKIEPPPRELWWTLTIFFVIFIYPARLFTGWAVGRALHQERPRWFGFRWVAGAATVPVVLFYVFIVFFAQYTSFLGPASILEQHAFLVPVPFLAL